MRTSVWVGTLTCVQDFPQTSFRIYETEEVARQNLTGYTSHQDLLRAYGGFFRRTPRLSKGLCDLVFRVFWKPLNVFLALEHCQEFFRYDRLLKSW